MNDNRNNDTNENDEFDSVELDALLNRAGSLPREIIPKEESWVIIRDRIEQKRVRELSPVAGFHSNDAASPVTEALPITRPPKQPFLRSTRGAALIAATLFLAVTTFVVKQQGSIDGSSGAEYATDTARADMTGVFARYDEAATDLMNDLERRRTTLNPAVVAVLDSALVTLDAAILETRDALRETPDNKTIAQLLEVSYQQKLDLLRRANELSEATT